MACDILALGENGRLFLPLEGWVDARVFVILDHFLEKKDKFLSDGSLF